MGQTQRSNIHIVGISEEEERERNRSNIWCFNGWEFSSDGHLLWQEEIRECREPLIHQGNKFHGELRCLVSHHSTQCNLLVTQCNLTVTVLTNHFATVSGTGMFSFFSTSCPLFAWLLPPHACYLFSGCLLTLWSVDCLCIALYVPVLPNKRESDWVLITLQHQHPYWTESLHQTTPQAPGRPIKCYGCQFLFQYLGTKQTDHVTKWTKNSSF